MKSSIEKIGYFVCSKNTWNYKMRIIAGILLIFYLLTNLVWPTQLLAKNLSAKNSTQLIISNVSSAEKTYTFPVSHSQATVEAEGKISYFIPNILPIFNFKWVSFKDKKCLTPKFNSATKIFYDWSKIRINAP